MSSQTDSMARYASRACSVAEGLSDPYSLPHYLDLERLPESWKWPARALLHAALAQYIADDGRRKTLNWSGRRWHLARLPENRLQVSSIAGNPGITSDAWALPDSTPCHGDTENEWRAAVHFRIGCNGSAGLDQMPDPRSFPLNIPDSAADERDNCACALGGVLAVAFLKLYRPWPNSPSSELDPCGGYLVDVPDYLKRLRGRIADPIRTACLMQMGFVIDMALNAPDRLPEIQQRIDAISNDELHRRAMEAVMGKTPTDLFEGVMA